MQTIHPRATRSCLASSQTAHCAGMRLWDCWTGTILRVSADGQECTVSETEGRGRSERHRQLLTSPATFSVGGQSSVGVAWGAGAPDIRPLEVVPEPGSPGCTGAGRLQGLCSSPHQILLQEHLWTYKTTCGQPATSPPSPASLWEPYCRSCCSALP